MHLLRTTSTLTVALALGCFPPSDSIGGSEPDGTTDPADATTAGPPVDPTTEGPPVDPTSTGDTTSTTAGPTDSTTDGTTDGITTATTTTGDTIGDTTGEPLPPGCGDGVAAPGELCFVRVPVDLFRGTPDSVHLADINGDGHLDLIASFVQPCPLVPDDGPHGPRPLDLAAGPDRARDGALFISVDTAVGDGSGGFALGPSQPPDGTASPTYTADVTGDGDVDVLLLHGAEVLRRFTGGVADPFAGVPVDTPLPFESLASDLAAGDLDGDGDRDVVIIGDSLAVLRNDGAGKFVVAELPFKGHQIALADLDADADLDVLVARTMNAGVIEVLRNDGAGGLASAQQVPFVNLANLAVLPDAGAGRPAVLVVNYLDTPKWQHLLAGPDGTLAPPEPIPGAIGPRFALGRFDGDALTDAVVVDDLGVTAVLAGLPWPPAGAPIADFKLDFGLATAAGDVNEDGVDDILIAGRDLLLSNP